MTSALIGYNGVVGSELLLHKSFDFLFNSSNITQLPLASFDVIVCAAPHGNRIFASQNPSDDLKSIEILIENLSAATTKKIVLIGTVDTQNYSDTVYGRHRLMLEDAIKLITSDHHIIRLGSLIGKNIKKNVLYDLHHDKFVDKINLDTIIQWSPLADLHHKIDYVIKQNIKEINLISQPISNLEIIQNFFPSMLAKIFNNQEIKYYNNKPYMYTKQEIFSAIQQYIK